MSPLDKKIKVGTKLPAWAKAAEKVLQQAVNKAVKKQREAGLPVYAVRQGKLQRVLD